LHFATARALERQLLQPSARRFADQRGTINGATAESRGANPLELPNRETRKYLKDGYRLTIAGWCEGNGYRVGFGEVTGHILSAA